MPLLPIGRLSVNYQKLNLQYTPPIKAIDKPKTGFWMVSATGGYIMNQTRLSAEFNNPSAEVENIYNERNSVVFDLKGGYYFGKKVGLKTGVGTYQMKEEFSFTESEWQYNTDSTYVPDITYVYDDSTGMVIDSVDASYYNYSTDSNYVNLSNFSNSNSLRIVRIPIYLSYMFNVGKFMIEP